MGFEIRPTLVGLVVDKDRGIDYEIDSKEHKYIYHKPKRFANNQSKWKKMYMDHVQVASSSLDNLCTQLDFDSQLAALFNGFNAAIFTLNTRSRIDSTSHLMFIVLDKVRGLLSQLHTDANINVSFFFASVTDTQCMDLASQEPISVHQLTDPNQFDQMFVDTDLDLNTVFNAMDDLPHLPILLQLKFSGVSSQGVEFHSNLLLADLAWAELSIASSATVHGLSLPKLQEIANTLAYLPLDVVVNPDDPFIALALPFLSGNSRNSWVIQADIEEPSTADLIRLADVLRRVKTLYSCNKPVTSSSKLHLLESSLSDAQLQRDELAAQKYAVQHSLDGATQELMELRARNTDLQLQLTHSKRETQEAHDKWIIEQELRKSMELSVVQVPILRAALKNKQIDMDVQLTQMNRKLVTTASQRDLAYFDGMTRTMELHVLRQDLNNEMDEAQLARVQRDQLVDLSKSRLQEFVELQAQYHELTLKYNRLVEKYDQTAVLAKSAKESHAQHQQFQEKLMDLERDFMDQKTKWAEEKVALEVRAVQSEADLQTMVDEAERCLRSYLDLESKNEEALELFKSETQKLTQQLADVEVALQNLTRRCVELESENEQLRACNQLRGVEVANTLSDVRRQKMQVETELSDAKIVIESLSTDKLALEQAVDRAKAETERVRNTQRHQETLSLRRLGNNGECDAGDKGLADEMKEMQTQFQARELELLVALEGERARAQNLAFDVGNLRGEVDRMHRRITQMNELNESMAAANLKLQTQLADAQQLADSRHAELHSAKAAASEAAMSVEQLRTQSKRRECELVSGIQNLETKLVLVTNQLQESNHQRDHVSNKLVRTEDELSHALSRLDRDRAEATLVQNKLEAQVHTLRMDKVDGRGDVSKDSERMAVVERDLELALQRLEDTRSKLDAEETRVRKERKAHDKAASEASRKIAQLTERVSELEDEIDKINASAQSRSSVQVAELRRENTELKEQARQVLELRTKLECAEKKRRDAEKRVLSLESEVAAFAVQTPEKPLISPAELGKLQRENKRLSSAILDLKEQVKSLQDDISAQESAGAGAISQVALHRLREDFAKAGREVELMRTEQEASAQQLTRVQDQLKRAQAYEAQVATARVEHESFEKELMAAYTKIQLLGRERDNLKMQLEAVPPPSRPAVSAPASLPDHSSEGPANHGIVITVPPSSPLQVRESRRIEPPESAVGTSVAPSRKKPAARERQVRQPRAKSAPTNDDDSEPDQDGVDNLDRRVDEPENERGDAAKGELGNHSSLVPPATVGNPVSRGGKSISEPAGAVVGSPARRQPARTRKAAPVPVVSTPPRQQQRGKRPAAREVVAPELPIATPSTPPSQTRANPLSVLDDAIVRETASGGDRNQGNVSDSSGSSSSSALAGRKKRRMLKPGGQMISVVPPGTPDVQGRLQSSLKLFTSGFAIPDLRSQAASARR